MQSHKILILTRWSTIKTKHNCTRNVKRNDGNAQQGAGENAVASNQQQGMEQPSGVSQQPEGTDSQGSGNGTIGVGATPTAGKLALLEMLLDLKNNHGRITKNV